MPKNNKKEPADKPNRINMCLSHVIGYRDNRKKISIFINTINKQAYLKM